MAPARSAAAIAAPVLALVACCVCIVIVHGPAHGRTELDEAGALRLAEGSGYVKVHRDPTINGADAGVAPHGWAALHEQKALALAEGKLRGDVGGRWHVHHHPHATAGADAAEERALALAEGKLHGDVGGRWHVHHHPHATRGRDAAEERALALAEGEVHGDVGGRWHVHQHPHSIAGSDEHEKRALALAEGKVHPHPYGRAHAAARNGAAEERALRLAEGKEGASARKSIAAGHATAIAKHEEEPVTIQTKWGPLSAANGARQQLLRSIEARPNMHFDKGVSAGEMKTLLARAARMTGAMHEKKESPLVQLNQIQELNAIEKKEAHLQHAMESGSEPARPLGPMGSAHAGDWRRAARGRRAQTLRETLALKLADGPSKPLGMKAHRAVVSARPLVARKMAKGRDLYHTAAFEEEAIAEKKKALAQKQARLKKILARRHEAAKMHQALRGVDVLAHGAQRALGDDMVSVTAIRRGWLGL